MAHSASRNAEPEERLSDYEGLSGPKPYQKTVSPRLRVRGSRDYRDNTSQLKLLLLAGSLLIHLVNSAGSSPDPACFTRCLGWGGERIRCPTVTPGIHVTESPFEYKLRILSQLTAEGWLYMFQQEIIDRVKKSTDGGSLFRSNDTLSRLTKEFCKVGVRGAKSKLKGIFERNILHKGSEFMKLMTEQILFARDARLKARIPVLEKAIHRIQKEDPKTTDDETDGVRPRRNAIDIPTHRVATFISSSSVKETLTRQLAKAERSFGNTQKDIVQQNLEHASEIIEILHERVNELPNEYAVIGKIIYDAMSRWTPVPLKRKDVLAKVGGFLFLRLVNPFFTEYFVDQAKNLTVSDPKMQKHLSIMQKNLRQNHIGFTKILQDLSNGMTQDKKDKPYLVGEFKPYYVTLLPKMANYLLESIGETPVYTKDRRYDVMELQPKPAPERIIPVPEGLPTSPEERLDLLRGHSTKQERIIKEVMKRAVRSRYHTEATAMMGGS